MEDNLISILETFGFPVFRQGSLNPSDSYPDTFFTFWNNSENGHSFYDNDVVLIDWDFDVNIYSDDPGLAYTLQKQTRKKLKNNNWIILQYGSDVPSDEITHIGRGMRVAYINKEA